jgi:tRNA(adenine34) deaminase
LDSTDDIDARMMMLAVAQAEEGIRTRNGEVGVVVTKCDTVVYAAYNTMNSTWDVTAHTEVAALRTLSMGSNSFDLSGHSLYCTLEPCGMCTCACLWAKVDRIVFGAGREDVSEEYFELDVLSSRQLIASARGKRPTLISGVLRDRCAQLYRDPRRTRRESQ